MPHLQGFAIGRWRLFPPATVLAIACFLSMPVYAATFSVPVTTTGAPGEIVSIPVTLDNASAMQGYFFNLTFNSSVVSYKSMHPGTLVSSWGTPQVNAIGGQVLVAGSGTNAINGSGLLATLYFEILMTADHQQTSALTFASAEVNDSPLDVFVANGQIMVDAQTDIRVPVSLRHAPNEEFDVPVTVDDAGGVLGYLVQLRFDAARLECLSVEAGSSTATWGAPQVNSQTGNITAASSSDTSLADGSGTVVNFHMRVKPAAPPEALVLLQIAIAELNDGAITTTAHNGAVEVASGTPTQKTWVDITYTGVETGSFLQPYNTLEEAHAAAPPGTQICLKGYTATALPGTYRLNRACRITSALGNTRIGKTAP